MSATEDHFNWPSASRKDTMYLSTLRPGETSFPPQRFARTTFSSLETSDIDKAKPYYHGYHYQNKETFINRNDDIEGSHPKKLHQPLNKPYFSLVNEDVKGSKPQSHKFVTTRQATDPLNPEYKLPHVEIRASTPPKFIRDQLDIKDIDGAKPNPYFKYNIERKNLTVDDIEGARPKKEWIPQGKTSSLNVKDINYFWEYHTKRVTNPLSPRYQVHDENQKIIDYGKIENKPIIRHPQVVNKEQSLALKTQDIIGAQAGTSVSHINKVSTRDDLLKTQDIPGAQVATLKKGMTTMRHVNPLNPEYKVPGYSEPQPAYERNTNPNKSGADYYKTLSVPKKETSTSLTQSQVIAPTKPTPQNHEYGYTNGSQNATTNIQPERKTPLVESKDVRRTPPPQKAENDIQFFDGEKRITTPLQKTGESIVAGNKLTEYVPAKRSEDNEKKTVEKKPPSPADFQKNTKKFYAAESRDEDFDTFSRPKTNAEKFDKFLGK